MIIQYVIDILFFIVLMAHIIKIDFLIKENEKNKRYFKDFFEISEKASEHIKKLYDLLDDITKKL